MSKAAPYYVRKCGEPSRCEELNLLPAMRAGSAQPSLSCGRAEIPLMHSSARSGPQQETAQAVTAGIPGALSLRCALTPLPCAQGAQHQLSVIFWGLQSRVFLLAGFSLKLPVDVKELKERRSIFKAILGAQNESGGTAWSEEQRCPRVNTHSL